MLGWYSLSVIYLLVHRWLLILLLRGVDHAVQLHQHLLILQRNSPASSFLKLMLMSWTYVFWHLYFFFIVFIFLHPIDRYSNWNSKFFVFTHLKVLNYHIIWLGNGKAHLYLYAGIPVKHSSVALSFLSRLWPY